MNNGDFSCDSETLNPPAFINIEAGDVIGACVFNPDGGRRRLNLVGNAIGYSLMQTADVSGCSLTSVPSLISSSQLSDRDSRILHLYANITSMIFCWLRNYYILSWGFC